MFLPFINKLILSLLIIWPILGSVIVVVLPHNKKNLLQKILLVIFACEFLFALHLPFHFSNTGVTDQFFIELPWLIDWNIFYRLGIDGWSLVLIVLTVVVMGILAYNQDRASGILFLLLTACLIGAFSALDLFLFAIFFQLSLFLIFFLTLHASTLHPSPFTLHPSPLSPVPVLLSCATLLTATLMLAVQCDASFNLFQLTNYRLPIFEQRIIAGLFILGLLCPTFLTRFNKYQTNTIFMPILGVYGLVRFVFPLLPNALCPLQSRLLVTILMCLTVLALLFALIRQIPFRRRLTIITICILILLIGIVAKPVWTLIDRSAETIILYMQSERRVVIAEGMKQ